MHFSIITPSFNQLDYLKRCVASVRDQVSGRALNVESVEASCKQDSLNEFNDLNGLNDLNGKASLSVHHHIQDGGSTDGTVDWLRQYDAEVRGRKTEVGGRKTDTAEVSLSDVALAKSEGQQSASPQACMANGQEAGPEGPAPRREVSSDHRPPSSDLCSSIAQRPEPNASLSGCTFSYESEPDNGMYDALNKGVAFALKRHDASCKSLKGLNAEEIRRDLNGLNECNDSTILTSDDGIVAWLNCDEQYLPGTLQKVARYFEDHPKVDILCGDVLLVDRNGRLLAFRKSYAPRRSYIEASHLYTLSCATFFRRRVFEQVGAFDATLKAAADEDFFLRALRMGFRAKHLPCFCSVFTFTENNLGGGAPAYAEHLQIKSRISIWVRVLKPAINMMRHLEKWWSRAYRQQFPMEYAIYMDNLNERSVFGPQSGSWRWPSVS